MTIIAGICDIVKVLGLHCLRYSTVNGGSNSYASFIERSLDGAILSISIL